MDESLKATFDNSATGAKNVKLQKIEGDKISLTFKDLDVEIPTGKRTLIRKANLHIEQGNKVAMTGGNGTGKSSLFRVEQGLWNFGNGSVETTGPKDMRVICASQHSRIPDTALDGILAYPFHSEHFKREDYEQALRDAEYPEMIAQLPWHAVTADNIKKVCAEGIADIIKETDIILDYQAENFIHGMKKALEKNLVMPRTTKGYFTDDVKNDVIESICRDVLKTLSHGTKSVTFPQRAGRKTGEKLAQIISRDMDKWMLRGGRWALSGGETQKLVFARLFLQKADIMFLDEPTSALKEDMANMLMRKLFEKLPDSTAIVIIHNESLLKHFTHNMDLENGTLTLKKLDDDALKAHKTCPTCKQSTPHP